MANNNLLYNAVLAGCVGASENGRWLTNPSVASYDVVRFGALNLASAVDALIPADPTLIQSDADLMQSIVQGTLSSRFVIATTDVTSLATAILGLWTNIKTAILNTTLTVVEFLGWDGLANKQLTALPAGHTAGLYAIYGIAVVTTPAGVGIFFRHIEWVDPLGGLQVNDSPAPIQLAVAATVPQTDPPAMGVSGGLFPITVEFQPAGVVPPLVANLYVFAQLIAKR